jgi:hypothetical protein
MIEVITKDAVISFDTIKAAKTEAELLSWLTDEPVMIRYADGSTETVKIDA